MIRSLSQYIIHIISLYIYHHDRFRDFNINDYITELLIGCTNWYLRLELPHFGKNGVFVKNWKILENIYVIKVYILAKAYKEKIA